MNRRPTTIEIRLDPADLRRWQLLVLDRLAATPDVDLRLAPTTRRTPRPAGLDLLFSLERLIARGLPETTADRLDSATLARFASPQVSADLVVDLVGDATSCGPEPTLVVRCSGAPPLDGAVAAILAGATPVATADLCVDGVVRPLARWPLAVEDRRSALRSASLAMGRVAHLVLRAVEAIRAAADPAAAVLPRAEGDDAVPAAAAPLVFFAGAFAGRIADRLTRLVRRPPTWAAAWRVRAPGGDPDRPDRDPTPFRRIPDDGARFYADPFVIEEAGRLHLFCEEFPFATGKGILSRAELGPDGVFGPMRPVLETDCHLSYPFLFRHAGRIWMIPETSGRRTVELWVADPFPDRWTLHSVLLDDVDVGDATLAEIDGTCWMFGASREPGTSSWEALSLWSAPAPTGPWTAHPANPVVVDVRSARPAGHLFRAAEGWCRPVQDSARGYGSGLAMATISHIGPDRYQERIARRFATPPPLLGLHTWNRAPLGERLVEVIDVHVAAAAFGDERRLDLAPSASV